MGNGSWAIVLGLALSMGCEAKTDRPPEPAPAAAEVTPPEVEPREGEPIVGDEADAEEGER